MDVNDNNVFFVIPGATAIGKPITSVQINGSSLALDTWYSYAVQFTVKDGIFSLLRSYENGTVTNTNYAMADIQTPSGGTYLFRNPTTGWPFSFGGITDFVFLESATISNEILQKFTAGAPFV